MKPQLTIIDDNEMMCEFLSVYFAKDYRINAYRDAKQALKNIQQAGAPNIILLDLNIPEFSGLDFLKAFQRNPKWKHSKIIVLSSKDKSTDRIECLSLGAQDYMVKPFHPKELALRIQNYAAIGNQ